MVHTLNKLLAPGPGPLHNNCRDSCSFFTPGLESGGLMGDCAKFGGGRCRRGGHSLIAPFLLFASLR